MPHEILQQNEMMSNLGNLYCLFALFVLSMSPVARPAIAQPPVANTWQTGANFDRQLLMPLSVRWSGQRLRTALRHLSETQHIAIFLDRRIDPGQTLELSIDGLMLENGLQAIAESRQLGLSLFDSVAYFGPPDAAADLRTLAALAQAEVALVPLAKRAALLETQPLSWPELTKPRELIAQTVKQAGLKLVGLERVPHDLWPAGSWPPMRLIDRLSLLAIGFDLQVRVSKDGTAIALVPRMKPAKIVKDYPAAPKTEQMRAELAKRLPEAEFKLSGGKLFVKGRVEDQAFVLYALSRGSMDANHPSVKPSPNPKSTAGTKVYTLTIQNQSLLPVLKALAKQMNLQLMVDEADLKAAGIDPTERISFQVKEATAEKLWQAALEPTGLSFELNGKYLRIFPSPEE